MPPLTWQNVAAPDFRGVTEALALSGRSLDAGFGGAADAIGKFGDARKENALADILNQTKGMTDPGQIRNAVAGMDTSGLGSGQFFQFDKMVGDRGVEATRQQAYEQLRSMNPLLLAAQDEKNRQALVMNPLLALAKQADIRSTDASTAGTAARTAANVLDNNYNSGVAESRLRAGISSFNDTTSLKDQTILDRNNDATARTVYADMVASLGPNQSTDAEAFIGRIPADTPPGVRARLIEMASAKLGSYPGPPIAAPVAAVAPAAQRIAAAAGGPPSGSPSVGASIRDLTPPLYIDDADNPGNTAYNQFNSTFATIRDRVVAESRAADTASGATAFETAAKSSTSQLDHVDRLKKSSLLSESRSNSINNALDAIKATAKLEGRPLNDSEAALIFERAIKTTDGVLTDSTWIGNSFQANSPQVLADIQALKIDAPRVALNATAKIETAVIRLNTLQTAAAKANQELSAAVKMAARRNGDPNSPQIQAYRRAAELASANVERGFAAFYRANPDYAAGGEPRSGTLQGPPAAPALSIPSSSTPSGAVVAGPARSPPGSLIAAAERNRDAVRAAVQIQAVNDGIQRVINDVAASLVLNAGNTEPTEEAIKRAASDNNIDLANLRRTTLNYFKDSSR